MRVLAATILALAYGLTAPGPFGAASAQGILHTILGDIDGLGQANGGAGDVNGDGYPDFVLGAPGFNPFYPSAPGYARVYSGKDVATLYVFTGSALGDQMGYSVDGAGDLDNDGFSDVIVGAPQGYGAAGTGGYARVFSGSTGLLLYQFTAPAAGDYLGRSVSGAGDVDGDGFDDVVVGAVGDDTVSVDCGAARVYSGQSGTQLYANFGSAVHDCLGRSVSEAGDVDQDGYADYVAGAPYDSQNGASAGLALVVSGKAGTVLYTCLGDQAGDMVGCCVSGAGDLNLDGRDDFATGSLANYARVFSGANGSPLFTAVGDAPGDRFGESVSGAGDTNADGVSDIAVTAGRASVNFYDSGMVRVLSGKNGATLFTMAGDHPAMHCNPVSAIGDINLDGYDDLVVGRSGADVMVSACEQIARYGVGCPSSGGSIPNLGLAGCSRPGSTVRLVIAHGVSGSIAFVAAGTAKAQIPLGATCTLLVQPALALILTLPLSGSGNCDGAANLLVAVPVITPGTIFLQAFVADPQTALGFAASNGLEVLVAP